MPIVEVRVSGEQIGVDLASAYKCGCLVVGLHQGGAAESEGVRIGDRLLSVRNDSFAGGGSHMIPVFHSKLGEVQTLLMEADRPFVITFYRPSVPTTSSYDDESKSNFIHQFLNCSVRDKAFRASNVYKKGANSTLIGIYKAVKQVEGVIGREEISSEEISAVLSHHNDVSIRLEDSVGVFLDTLHGLVQGILVEWSESEEGARTLGNFSVLDIMLGSDASLLDQMYFLYERNAREYREYHEAMLGDCRRVLDLCTASAPRSLSAVLRGSDSKDDDALRQALFLYYQHQCEKGTTITMNPLLSVSFAGDPDFVGVNELVSSPAERARLVRLAVHYPSPGRLEYCLRQVTHSPRHLSQSISGGSPGAELAVSRHPSNAFGSICKGLRLHLPPLPSPSEDSGESGDCSDTDSHSEGGGGGRWGAELVTECVQGSSLASLFMALLLEEKVVVVARSASAGETILQLLLRAVEAGGYLQWEHSYLPGLLLPPSSPSATKARIVATARPTSPVSPESEFAGAGSKGREAKSLGQLRGQLLRKLVPAEVAARMSFGLPSSMSLSLSSVPPIGRALSRTIPSLHGLSSIQRDREEHGEEENGEMEEEEEEEEEEEVDVPEILHMPFPYLAALHPHEQLPLPHLSSQSLGGRLRDQLHSVWIHDLHHQRCYAPCSQQAPPHPLEVSASAPGNVLALNVSGVTHAILTLSFDRILRPCYQGGSLEEIDASAMSRVDRLVDVCASFLEKITRDAKKCCFRAGSATFFDEESYLRRARASLLAEIQEAGSGLETETETDQVVVEEVEAFLARFASTQHFSLYLTGGMPSQ